MVSRYCHSNRYANLYNKAISLRFLHSEKNREWIVPDDDDRIVEILLSWIWFGFVCRNMGPTWDPSGADRTQVGPMLAPWTLLSGIPYYSRFINQNRPRMDSPHWCANLAKESGKRSWVSAEEFGICSCFLLPIRDKFVFDAEAKLDLYYRNPRKSLCTFMVPR